MGASLSGRIVIGYLADRGANRGLFWASLSLSLSGPLLPRRWRTSERVREEPASLCSRTQHLIMNIENSSLSPFAYSLARLTNTLSVAIG